MDSLAPQLDEMESYRYHTIYQYQVDGEYPEDALAVEVVGAHSGRLPVKAEQPEEGPLILASDLYERTQVEMTDLHSGYQEEVILNSDGIWVRFDGDEEWIELSEAGQGDLLNLPDIFSPQSTFWVVAQPYVNAGVFVPGAPSQPPLMSQSEEMDDREVTHRCWVYSEEDGVWGQEIAHPGIFTLLMEAEFHLWTAEEDTEFVRLAITGSHWGECPADCDYVYQHDNLRTMLLSMELSEVGTPVEIGKPGDGQIGLKISSSGLEPTGELSAPINELPLPADASPAPIPADVKKDPREYPYEEPREYIGATNRFTSNMMAEYASPNWAHTPASRTPTYLTELGMVETTTFYLEEMSRRGWELKGRIVRLGMPELYLFFEKDEVVFLITLSPDGTDGTSISAILPPSAEVLEAVRNGWTAYTPGNSELSGEFLNDLAVDNEERIWTVSDGGVDAFDGTDWSQHEVKNVDGWNSPIKADEDGNIFVGSSYGLAKFDGQDWLPIEIDDKYGNVTRIFMDPPGKIWMSLKDGSEGNGLGLLEGEEFTYISNEEIGFHNSHIVTDLIRDPRGGVWISTDGGGLFAFDGDEWRTEQPPECPPNYVGCFDNDLLIDQQGWLWINKPGALQVYNGQEWGDYSSNSVLPYQNIEKIAVDQHNRLWATSYYGGLSVLETDGQWITYTPDPPSNWYNIEAIQVDPKGRIWLATLDGVMVFDPPDPSSTQEREFPAPSPAPPSPAPLPEPGEGWTRYTIQNSALANNVINSLVVDNEDQVWIGTEAGLNVISPDGSQVHYGNVNSSLRNDYISTISFDDQNRLWIGTGNGLARLDPDGSWTLFPPDEGLWYPIEEVPEDAKLLYPNIDALAFDSDERLWMGNNANGTGQAITVMDKGGNWEVFIPQNSGLPDAHVLTLAVDDQDQVWAGTWDGISVMGADGRWETTSIYELGIKGEYDSVTDIVFDDSGRMWIGTTGGLVVMDPDGSLTQYTTLDSELINDYVRALHIDEQGRVWIGTAGGLSVLEIDGSWTNHPSGNALLPLGGITDLAMDAQERMWAGTPWGVSVFIP
jgi:ligand-binding sensor domain-containing protein